MERSAGSAVCFKIWEDIRLLLSYCIKTVKIQYVYTAAECDALRVETQFFRYSRKKVFVSHSLFRPDSVTLIALSHQCSFVLIVHQTIIDSYSPLLTGSTPQAISKVLWPSCLAITIGPLVKFPSCLPIFPTANTGISYISELDVSSLGDNKHYLGFLGTFHSILAHLCLNGIFWPDFTFKSVQRPYTVLTAP